MLATGCAQKPAGVRTTIADPPAATTLPTRPPRAIGAPGSIPGLANAMTANALAAFRRACPALRERPDRSGLTQRQDWAAACADPESDPAVFFNRHFTAVRNGDGTGLVTGYYEPEIDGSRTRTAHHTTPIHGVPKDLVEARLDDFDPALASRTIRGRVEGGRLIPYPDRAAIESGAIADLAPVIGWTSDPVGLFFLHIQGSGLLRLPDGSLQRVGYASQNGRPYVAIGRLLRQRELVPPPVGMAEIRSWLATNPEAGRALMRENPSYVFLRLLDPALDGPLGALGVPLIPRANVAADPATMPLGAPVWLETSVDGRPWSGLVVASDTGGAIRGTNRFDLFFGPGPEAARLAGQLQSPGEALLLLPKAAVARLGGQ